MKQALADALEDRGYTTLTPVQEAVSDPELIGADLLVSAQTGSGKTLAFGLAIAPNLLGEDDVFDVAGRPLALVIAPTRELALQVKRELAWLYAKAGAVVASCVGGMDMRDERRALARGAHIVIATPGRLRDHIMRGSIELSDLRAVVLDEADEMLDLGFREDLEFILGEAPQDRQTLLFSATVPQSIAGLAKSYQRDAIRITTKSEHSQHADITYNAMLVADRDAENAIINTLRFHEAPNAIVFCNTRAMVNRLTTRMSNRGFSVVALSGELSQTERTHALQAMRDGRARVCVATDVAARGIDLPNLDLVVHAELPNNHETLLHRSGRTGRAGRKGVSALIVTPKVRKKAERLLKWAKLTAEWAPAPSAEAVIARDEERMLADPHWHEPTPESDQGTVDKLVEQFSAEQLAAAYLQLYHARHSAPEELSDVNDAPPSRKERAPFGPSVWFSIEGGRAKNAEPRRLLPMLCKMGDLTKEDIGAIRIQETQSFVEIRESSVAGFLKTIGDGMTVEDGAALVRLDAAPSFSRGARPDHADRKPRGGKKPYGDKKAYGDRKPSGDKPRHDKVPRKETDEGGEKPRNQAKPKRDDKPHYDGKSDKPRGGKPRKSTPPTEWNDDPAPRVKKPKPASKGGNGKPKHASGDKKPAVRSDDGAVTSIKPKKGGAGGYERPKRGAKGPPPPKGKPSSKKNKARAASKADMSNPSKRVGGPRSSRRKP